jgi:hypothetical protein
MQYLGLPSPDPATLPPPPRPVRTSKRSYPIRLAFLIVGMIVLADFLYRGVPEILFGMFMMLLGMVLTFECYVQWERRLARNGVLGWGKVLQSDEHWIVYEFQPPGSDRTYRHTVMARPEFREQYGKPGSQLAFLYDPAKPQRHKPLVEFRMIEFIGKGMGTS